MRRHRSRFPLSLRLTTNSDHHWGRPQPDQADEAQRRQPALGGGLTYIRLEWEFVYRAVILDAYSDKMLGWELDSTPSARLAITALEKAIRERQPPPGPVHVHHSDRPVQYASSDYRAILRKHHMISSMSLPANPYDNASCGSFLTTRKREENRPPHAAQRTPRRHSAARTSFSSIPR